MKIFNIYNSSNINTGFKKNLLNKNKFFNQNEQKTYNTKPISIIANYNMNGINFKKNITKNRINIDFLRNNSTIIEQTTLTKETCQCLGSAYKNSTTCKNGNKIIIGKNNDGNAVIEEYDKDNKLITRKTLETHRAKNNLFPLIKIPRIIFEDYTDSSQGYILIARNNKNNNQITEIYRQNGTLKSRKMSEMSDIIQDYPKTEIIEEFDENNFRIKKTIKKYTILQNPTFFISEASSEVYDANDLLIQKEYKKYYP